MEKFKFSDNFLWGGSSSAYQIEGAWDTDGKGKSIMDEMDVSDKGITDFKVCSDHYNKYKEDVALMAEMGFNEYRFSISWTRIFPKGNGEINQKGVDFYNDLIDELIKYKIEPVVTMFHFDLPIGFAGKGGFLSEEVCDAFYNYCKTLLELYGEKVKYWLTFNEQNMFVMFSNMLAGQDHKQEDMLAGIKNMYQINHNIMVAESKVMKLCHEMYPSAKIGVAPNISSVYPASSKPEDFAAALKFSYFRNWLYLDPICKGQYSPLFIKELKNTNLMFNIKDGEMEILKEAKPNFMGINYYTTSTVMGFKPTNMEKLKSDQQNEWSIPGIGTMAKNENLKKTQFGWEMDPLGFKNTLKEIYDRYQLPILITENGLGAKDTLESDNKIHDEYRIDFLREHIRALGEAINEGVDVIGYSPWSAIDLVSTHEGIEKRYGFVYVNRDEKDLKDMKRYKKDSFFWYQKVISSNGTEL